MALLPAGYGYDVFPNFVDKVTRHGKYGSNPRGKATSDRNVLRGTLTRDGLRCDVGKTLNDRDGITPFRGKSTHHAFTGHLQKTLNDRNEIPPLLLKDIEEKRFVSPDLAELLKTSPSVSGDLQTSPSVPEVLQTSPSISGDLQIQPSDREVSQTSLQRVYEEDDKTWKNVGLLSGVVALFSCALSPTFHRLIRGWNALKFFLYGVVFLVIFATIVFARQSSRSKQHVLKKIIGFAVLMFMALFTLYYDRALNGKPDIPGLVSTLAFAFVSLSLFKLINFGQEMGIFAFCLSCFVAQLWTINKMLILVAIIVGYPLFHMHSSSDSGQDQRARRDIETGLA